MNRMWILCWLWRIRSWRRRRPALQARSSRPYQPAVPAATTVNTYGGYPGYSGGGTAAGNAMNGMASVISAKGDYNLSTSAAAINMTQAQKNEIQNRQQWTNTYFDMRATNKAARGQRGRPSAHDGADRPDGPRGRAQAAEPHPSGSRQRSDQLARAPSRTTVSRTSAARSSSFSARGPGTAASAIPTR